MAANGAETRLDTSNAMQKSWSVRSSGSRLSVRRRTGHRLGRAAAVPHAAIDSPLAAELLPDLEVLDVGVGLQWHASLSSAQAEGDLLQTVTGEVRRDVRLHRPGGRQIGVATRGIAFFQLRQTAPVEGIRGVFGVLRYGPVEI